MKSCEVRFIIKNQLGAKLKANRVLCFAGAFPASIPCDENIVKELRMFSACV